MRRSLMLDPKLAAIGVCGGLLSGLLGVGGGVVMVPLLVLWASYGQRDAHAISLGAIIPISIAGIATYGIAGEVRWWDALALAAGSIVREAYGSARVEERHRHRYEVNNHYREQLEAAGIVFSGTNPDLDLVEFVELPRDVHPYYVSTQAHPELRSRPTRPHPLFAGLVGAALERQKAERFPIDETGLRREPVDD